MKLETIINSKQAIENLSKQNLPIRIAFELKTFIQKLNPEFTAFFELRNAKMKEYGTPGEVKPDGSQVFTFTPENTEKFNAEINEVLDKDIDADIPVIKISDLEKKEVSISAADLIILEWLIK
jgi:hypothetical protein